MQNLLPKSSLIGDLFELCRRKGFDIFVPFKLGVYHSAVDKQYWLKGLVDPPENTLALLIGNTRNIWPHFLRYLVLHQTNRVGNPQTSSINYIQTDITNLCQDKKPLDKHTINELVKTLQSSSDVVIPPNPFDTYTNICMQEIVALAKTYTKQHETGSQAIFRPSSSSSLLETVSAISMPVTGTATEQLSLSDSVERSTVLEPYIKYYYDVGEGGGPAVAMQRLCHAIGFAHYDTSRGMCTHPIFGPWFAMRAVVVLPIDVSTLDNHAFSHCDLPPSLRLSSTPSQPVNPCLISTSTESKTYAVMESSSTCHHDNVSIKAIIQRQQALTALNSQYTPVTDQTDPSIAPFYQIEYTLKRSSSEQVTSLVSDSGLDSPPPLPWGLRAYPKHPAWLHPNLPWVALRQSCSIGTPSVSTSGIATTLSTPYSPSTSCSSSTSSSPSSPPTLSSPLPRCFPQSPSYITDTSNIHPSDWRYPPAMTLYHYSRSPDVLSQEVYAEINRHRLGLSSVLH